MECVSLINHNVANIHEQLPPLKGINAGSVLATSCLFHTAQDLLIRLANLKQAAFLIGLHGYQNQSVEKSTKKEATTSCQQWPLPKRRGCYYKRCFITTGRHFCIRSRTKLGMKGFFSATSFCFAPERPRHEFH